MRWKDGGREGGDESQQDVARIILTSPCKVGYGNGPDLSDRTLETDKGPQRQAVSLPSSLPVFCFVF